MTDAPFVPFADNDAAVARKMLDLYDADAVLRLKDQAEEADRIGDTRSARAWLDIAECVIMDLLFGASGCLDRQGCSARTRLAI
jgi:hypothetical protein